jgi:hypothetical protein
MQAVPGGKPGPDVIARGGNCSNRSTFPLSVSLARD